MPLGLVLSIIALGVSMAVVDKAMQQGRFGRVILVASVMLVIVMVAQELDSGFWIAVLRH